MAIQFSESDLETSLISRLIELGYVYASDNAWAVERSLNTFINEETLFESLKKINPKTKNVILEEVVKTVKNINVPSLFERNNKFHNYLTDGVVVEDHSERVNPLVKLIDYDNISNNIFEVYNQLKFKEYHSARIPDVIIYINGLPLVVFELKSLEVRQDTCFLENAYKQLGEDSEDGGYRYDIPTLFNYNAFLVMSDGATSKLGTLTSDYARYNEWKSKDGEQGYKKNFTKKLDTLLDGVFTPIRLCDIIKNNLFFMHKNKEKPVKILAQYHQYFGVLKAYSSIKDNVKPKGKGKAGIIWHTQGSGKSYSMVMLSHRLISDTSFGNPTIVVMTDRNDLDEQLYGTFANSAWYLRTKPVLVKSRKDLIKKIGAVQEGGIFFTTIQKFDKDNIVPNTRNNIIVLSDEAHRSHYGLDEKIKITKGENGSIETESIYGYEKYIRDALPNATFLGWTGTPVETKDHSTSDVFGNVIDTYDMTQSVEDGSTVKIYYESRLAKVNLDEKILKKIDEYYHTLAEQQAPYYFIERSKESLSTLETIVGAKERLELVAKDIYAHYSERKAILNGKAMVVCMSRKIAFDLYNTLMRIAPELKERTSLIVTESNKDSKEMRDLFKDSEYRKRQAEEFKKKDGKLKIAIVVDMWLTGFDVVDLDVMYIDKKMKGHTLMQAIARVNRVFSGKESGLVVDYIGIKRALNSALNKYTKRDKELNLKDIQESAKVVLDEKLSVLDEMLHSVNKAGFFGNKEAERFKAVQNGADFVLTNEETKKEYLKLAKQLKNANVVALGILDSTYRQKVLYYITVRYFIQKIEYEPDGGKFNPADINKKIIDLISEAIKGDEVRVLTKVNTAGTNRSVWDLLTAEKIEELRKTNPPHIFIKIMERLLKEAVAEYRGYNLVKAKEYSDRLRKVLEIYNTREDDTKTDLTIIGLKVFAEDMVKDETTAKKNRLSGRERAFYDALATNKSALELIGDDLLRIVAIELKGIVEEYATVDWSRKENTRAKMRIQIKKVLKKYKYPPDYREEAIKRVIDQAEYMM